MREKLLDLMKSEGLKPSQFAELLGINPAGVSHILAGRNKPGFDLLQKILRRFPRINPDWLLLDSTQMYRNGSEPISGPSASGSAVDQAISDGLFAKVGAASPESDTARQKPAVPEMAACASSAKVSVSGTDSSVKRIVILYDDGTFESYMPTKR